MIKKDLPKERVVIAFDSPEMFDKLQLKAEIKGLKPSAYCKMLVYENLNQ